MTIADEMRESLTHVSNTPNTITHYRGEWLYVDADGDKWRLAPTGERGCPLVIMLLERNDHIRAAGQRKDTSPT